MGKYITNLKVSSSPEEETALKQEGFAKINFNLNEGLSGNKLFLWYKKGDTPAITRVQVSFNEKMKLGLEAANYTKISINLNPGNPKKPIYMWYSTVNGANNPPIEAVNVTTEPASEADTLMSGGVWEKVTCDLNCGAGGNYVYVWVQREAPIYICDVTVTDTYDQDKDLFSKGFTRVDVSTNMGAPGGAEVFIWYNKTTDSRGSVSALDISTTSDEYEKFGKDGFQSVNIDLNEGTSGGAVYLWRNDADRTGKKVQGLVLLLNMEAVAAYTAAEVKVIKKSLNNGNSGAKIYMCYV